MASANGDGLSRARPAQAGIDARDVEAFLDDLISSNVELHTLMVYRAGNVVVEGSWWPYRPDQPHMLHSATKSFLSVAVGLAIHEGYFQLKSKIIDIFPDRLPAEVTANLAAVTVEDLLTQTSGHDNGISGGEWRGIKSSWIDEFFSLPVVHRPGTEFVYTSATSFMLSATLSRTTGQTVREFLEPRLFQPLGIKMLAWDVGPESICPGGNGISCLPADFLKLGVLHLQKGKWHGMQILPESWAVESTRGQRGNQHGYHWWTNGEGHYWASGLFGQICVVLPEHDAVVMTTAAVPRGADPLRAVLWRHFPRIFRTGTDDIDRCHEQRLIHRLDSLRILPEPQADPSLNEEATVLVSKEHFTAMPNQDDIYSFAFDFRPSDRSMTFHLQDARGFHQVRLGFASYIDGVTTLTGAKLHHGYEPAHMRVVAGASWTALDTLQMTLQFVESAFRDTFVVRFFANYTMASLDRRVSVNSFGTRRPTVFGVILKTGKELDSPELKTKMATEPRYSTAETTVGELLDNPVTRKVLEDEFPDLLKNPRLGAARKYTFDLIVRHAGLELSDLAHMNERLASLGS